MYSGSDLFFLFSKQLLCRKNRMKPKSFLHGSKQSPSQETDDPVACLHMYALALLDHRNRHLSPHFQQQWILLFQVKEGGRMKLEFCVSEELIWASNEELNNLLSPKPHWRKTDFHPEYRSTTQVLEPAERSSYTALLWPEICACCYFDDDESGITYLCGSLYLQSIYIPVHLHKRWDDLYDHGP